MSKKRITQKAIKQELIDVLQVALYDLHDLNRHDPLKVPRCYGRARNVLVLCGIEKVKMPNLPPIVTLDILMSDILGLMNALLDEKIPAHRLPRTTFHASNIIAILKQGGIDVIKRRADAARSSKKTSKVSKARKKIRPEASSSKPKKRT